MLEAGDDLAIHPNGDLYTNLHFVSASLLIYQRSLSGSLTLRGTATGYVRRSPLVSAGSLSLAASPQAAVFTVSPADNAIAQFQVKPSSGTLRLVDYLQDTNRTPAGTIELRTVVTAPDEQQLVVGLSGVSARLAVFDRGSGNEGLSFRQLVLGEENKFGGILDRPSVAISHDGKNVYVTDNVTTAPEAYSLRLYTYARANGSLTEQGFSVLNGYAASALVVSPDDATVLVGADSEVVLFRRNADGSLTVRDRIERGGQFGIVFSPDSKFAYVFGYQCEVFSSLGTALHRVQECSGTLGSLRSSSVAMSPDGQNVYVTGATFDGGASLLGYKRNAVTGKLSQQQTLRNGQDGVEGLSVAYFSNTIDQSIAVSADGRFVYVVSADDQAIAVFRRDTATGMLTFAEAKR